MVNHCCCCCCCCYILEGNALYFSHLFLQTISRFGKLDILVSNATVNPAIGRTLDVRSYASNLTAHYVIFFNLYFRLQSLLGIRLVCSYGCADNLANGERIQILDINIKAAALLVKEAYPHLKASKNGSVVFVSSIAGYTPFPVRFPCC